MLFAACPKTVDEHVSFGLDRPPAMLAGNIFDESDRSLLVPQKEQLDFQSIFEPFLEPFDLVVEKAMFGIDETNNLRVLTEVPGGDIDDRGF
jgi:hypothetical protein